jgi:hypothetical protein
MSRNTLIETYKTNLSETGLTSWYGLIGASLSVGAPLIGTMNPAMAIISAAVPLLARWNQTSEISSEHHDVGAERFHYYAQSAIKAIVNIGMLVATYSIGVQLGQAACFLFLISFCASKFINLGDASPIKHIEDFFSKKQKVYPENRHNFFSSLSANASDTLKATFYGLIAIATQFPLPYIGQVTEVVASMLFVAPLTAKISQINTMKNDLEEHQVKQYRSKALVSTVMDILVGLGLFASATALQLDKIAILAVLTGWTTAKLTSGGENSPIHYVHNFFNKIAKADANSNRLNHGSADRVQDRANGQLSFNAN